ATSSRKALCSLVLNVGAAALTEYRPGFRLGAEYSPAEFVSRTRFALVSVFRTVTFAFDTTAPLLSVTRPTMRPCGLCATIQPRLIKTAAAASRPKRSDFIGSPVLISRKPNTGWKSNSSKREHFGAGTAPRHGEGSQSGFALARIHQMGNLLQI